MCFKQNKGLWRLPTVQVVPEYLCVSYSKRGEKLPVISFNIIQMTAASLISAWSDALVWTCSIFNHLWSAPDESQEPTYLCNQLTLRSSR